MFLEGNHSLQTPLELIHISSLSLIGARNDSSVNIVCRESISFTNAANIIIKALQFNTTLIFNQGRSINILNSVFLSGEPSVSAALSSYHSNIKISNCSFESHNNTSVRGGAIFGDLQSKLTLSGSNFTRNGAGAGGAIYASESSILLLGTVVNFFKYNFCTSNNFIENSGGAIYCTKCTINITGENYFENNECLSHDIKTKSMQELLAFILGGLLYLELHISTKTKQTVAQYPYIAS